MSNYKSTLRYQGLPHAKDEQSYELLKAPLCFVEMSGNREVRFAVPSPLLSRVSGNMNSLIKEADSPAHGSVILEVDNKGTFYRFYQFIHTGDYDDFVPQEKVDVAGSSNMSAQMGALAAKAVDESPSQPDLFRGFSRRTSNTDAFKIC